ncbi:MAG: twin-arginine translocation signal domain-containing protein, partial [Thermomicrobiales bacterium]|nr:twin-arginine translocation signal domain-containing protein [Thermomicrobiales bacterium]
MTKFTGMEITRRNLMKFAGASAAAGAITAASLQGLSETAAAQEPVEGGTLSIAVSQITSNSHLLHLRHYAGSENIYTRLLANARL